MKSKKRKLSIIFGVMIICSLALFSGCGERENRGYDDSLISPDWYSEKMNMSSAKDYTEEEIKESGKMLSESSGYPVVVSVEDMVAHSSLIVRGRVLGFDFLTIQHATSDSTYVHTDYHVEILDILRGEPYDNEVITVRTKGGENDKEIDLNNDFDITVGKEYIFLLWMPKTVGTAYCTDGDYYAIVDYNAGYFEANNKLIKNADGISIPQEFAPCTPSEFNKEKLNYLEFTSEINELNRTVPVYEKYYLKSTEDALKENLENGFINQQEYDRLSSSIGKYGTILYYTQPGDVTVNP